MKPHFAFLAADPAFGILVVAPAFAHHGAADVDESGVRGLKVIRLFTRPVHRERRKLLIFIMLVDHNFPPKHLSRQPLFLAQIPGDVKILALLNFLH